MMNLRCQIIRNHLSWQKNVRQLCLTSNTSQDTNRKAMPAPGSPFHLAIPVHDIEEGELTRHVIY